MSTPAYPPVPPHELPPARTVTIPDRGEFFIRDSGDADRPPHRPLHRPPHRHAPARLDGQRGPQLARRLRPADRRRLPRPGHRPPRPRPRAACARPVPPHRLRRRCRRRRPRARVRTGDLRRLLDGRHDRPADRPRPPRRGQRHRPQRHRPALPGPRNRQGLAVDGRAEARPLPVPAGRLASGLSPRQGSQQRADGVVAVGADPALGAGHRRGRPRARPFRLAPVARRRERARQHGHHLAGSQRLTDQAARARRGDRRATVFEAPVDHLEITSRATEYNPALLDAVAAVRAADPVPA